ncbi:MAG: hypothetical protein E7Z91_00490 [Cyanobacteria bacterium SIG30]|nr:hypothetical protein [Cyanobacteria bacterium SIG30]
MLREFTKNTKKYFMAIAIILAFSQSVYAVTSYDNSIGLSGSTSILDMNTTQPASDEVLKLKNASGITKSDAKITISLRDSDVRQVLRMIADKANINIIFHESVEGKVTLDLKNVTLNEAFHYVLSTCELNYYLEDKTVIIATSEAAKESSFAKQILASFPIKYVNASNVALFLNDNVYGKNVTGISGNKIATSNPRTNEVLIFGTKSDIEVAKKVITKLDTKPVMTHFRVTHTTPKQMADFICKSLFADGEGAEGEDAAKTDSELLGLTLGGGSVACIAKVDEAGSDGAVFKAQPATIVYMEQAGQVGIFGGSYEQAKMVQDFIALHDKKQTMAFLELNIVELNESGSNTLDAVWNINTPFVNFGFNKNTGIILGNMNILSVKDGEWKFLQSSNPAENANISTTIAWLIKDGKGRTIANPKIMATNGQKSVIDLTSDYVESVTTQYQTGTMTSQAIAQKTYNIANDNGIKIELTPFISPEGYVSLNIKPEYASIKQKIYDTTSGESANENDIVATLLQRRDLELNNIRVKDGETLILAGFVTENETQTTSKFPVLGDLPLIGALFRSSVKELSKEEMIIMITPHIVYGEDDMKRIEQKSNSNIQL